MITAIRDGETHTTVGVNPAVPETPKTETLAPSSGRRVPIVTIHVDGSATPNPGVVTICWATAKDRQTCVVLEGTHSNNYAELASVGVALRGIHAKLTAWNKDPKQYHIRLYSDSQTVRVWLTGSTPGKEVQEYETIVRMIARITVTLIPMFGRVTILPVGSDRNWAHPNGQWPTRCPGTHSAVRLAMEGRTHTGRSTYDTDTAHQSGSAGMALGRDTSDHAGRSRGAYPRSRRSDRRSHHRGPVGYLDPTGRTHPVGPL